MCSRFSLPRSVSGFFVPHTQRPRICHLKNNENQERFLRLNHITAFFWEIGANIGMEVYYFPSTESLRKHTNLNCSFVGRTKLQKDSWSAEQRWDSTLAAPQVRCSGGVCSFFFPMPLLACVELIIFFPPFVLKTVVLRLRIVFSPPKKKRRTPAEMKETAPDGKGYRILHTQSLSFSSLATQMVDDGANNE